MAKKPVSAKARIIRGTLEAFSDQGTEGSHWCLFADGGEGMEALVSIRDGDVLRVFNDAARKQEIWRGVVSLDHDINKSPLPLARHLVMQRLDCLGTVHGIQRGIDPEKWGQMFVDEKPAILVRRRPGL